LHGTFRFLWRVILAFIADNCSYLAAGLCYFVFFSIFPLLLLLVAVAGHFLSAEQTMAQAHIFTQQLFSQQADLVDGILAGVMTHRSEFSIFGIALLAWSSKNIFSSLGQALNVIWKVPADRGYVQENLLAIGMAFSVGILIILSSLGLAVLTTVTNYKLPFLNFSPSQLPGFLFFLADVLPFLGVITVLTLLYWVLPNRRLHFYDVFPGALTASISWEMLRRLFGYYLDHMARYDMVYGSLSGIVGFLFWIYVSAILILLGAEVSRVSKEFRQGFPLGKEHDPLDAPGTLTGRTF
jgi:membrane protein